MRQVAKTLVQRVKSTFAASSSRATAGCVACGITALATTDSRTKNLSASVAEIVEETSEPGEVSDAAID